ncbi:MAG: methyltransferase [Humibacillus sp.]|nr:methyltransferase [Humibacillus sp.]MDN5779491.1 methyltransferase [Humibacillus sp.]
MSIDDLVGALRSDLTRAGFTVDGVGDRLGPLAAAALHREQPVPAILATAAATDACGVLIALFSLGESVGAHEVEAALPSLGVAGAVELGLVRAASGLVKARCDLRPYGDDNGTGGRGHDWWVASDLGELQTGTALRPDHVLGIGGASTTLASWTIRRPVERALDLGTGCGVQALHLAAHALSVLATDISERVRDYAVFNAALNETELDVRVGDMLEPVAGQQFSLVVSNPPFVITPRVDGVTRYEYRDGGRAGDALVRSLVREVGAVLEPGGVAQFLGNWEVPRGRTWREVWEEWLEGVSLDAWVVQRDTQDPAEYAELWSRDGGVLPGTAEYRNVVAAWLQDFAARDVASIGFGVVTLQRPLEARDPWRDLADVTGPVAPALGPTVEAGLQARTWLAEHDDDEVLAVAWSCAPDVTEERYGRPGAEHPNVIVFRQGGGLRRSVRADTVLAAYLGVADGELTARAALDAIAELVGADAAAVRAEMAPRLRDLVADGLLV